MKWFALIFTFSLQAQAAPLTIDVSNLKDGGTSIQIALFASEASWRGEHSDQDFEIAPLTPNVSTITIDVPPGEYAFFLFQDMDGDKKLKQNALRFPQEPYGFSNNVKINVWSMDKPKWKDLKFTVSAGATAVQPIKLNR